MASVIRLINTSANTVIDISTIVAGSITLDRAICTSEQLDVGGCIASQFTVELYGDIPDDFDRIKYVNIEDSTEDVVFSGFISNKTTNDNVIYKITAYDDFAKNVNVANWYNSIFSNRTTIPISTFLYSLLDNLGIQYIGQSMPVNFDIKKTILAGNIDGVQMLKWICELQGGFGVIIPSGFFNIVWLDNSTSTQIDVMSGFDKSNITAKTIDKVQIRAEADDVGAIAGTGTNALIIQGNPLVFGKTSSELSTIANAILPKVSTSSYVPFEAEMVEANAKITLGKLYAITSSNDTINSYVLSTSLSGSNLVNQTIKADGVETREEIIGDVNSELLTTSYNMLKIQKTVDEYSTEISKATTDSAEALSKATQSLDEFSWLVKSGTSSSNFVITDRLAKLVTQAISLVADDISITGDRIAITSDNFSLTKAGKVTASDITITGGKMKTSVQRWIDMTEDDIQVLIKYIKGQTTLTDAQKVAYDINCDGTVDMYDYAYWRKTLMGLATVDDYVTKFGYVKQLSTVVATIDCSANNVITIWGKNSWGREFNAIMSLEKMVAQNGYFKSLNPTGWDLNIGGSTIFESGVTCLKSGTPQMTIVNTEGNTSNPSIRFDNGIYNNGNLNSTILGYLRLNASTGYFQRVKGDYSSSYNMIDTSNIKNHVGEVVSSTDMNTTVSISSGTSSWTHIGTASVTLTKGTWLVTMHAEFSANSTGIRRIGMTSSAIATPSYANSTSVKANGTVPDWLECSSIYVITKDEASAFIMAQQNSGSTLNAKGFIRAVRLSS